MKVAIFLPSLAGGGAERIALFATERLRAAGIDAELIVARAEGALVDAPVFAAHGVDLGAPNELLSLPALLRYVDRARPDLLFAFVHSAKIVAGLAKLRRPWLRVAISVHNALEVPRRARFWPRALFGYAPERRLYRDVVAAQAVSRDLAAQVVRQFALPPERVHTIYNPLPDRLAPGAIDAGHEAIFARPVIVNAGRMVAQKDQAALIRAFHAAGLHRRARLLILGEGPLRGALAAQVRALGLEDSVAMPGFVADVRPYMARSAGFVLSSRNEGFGLVLAEALSVGCPVASFDCPSGPRELLADGALGTLIAADDEAALGRAMTAMVDGTAVRAAPERVAAHLRQFAPDTIAAQYVALVRSLVPAGAVA
ncbi:glycosyltransferase [Sphingomonas sp. NPDC079357]|uniref:glycosyltransferase n=1 Tax=Sphingomonas sp. NPDC079357 TaxID=3364518 RepID=UPI00384BA36F